MKRLARFLEGYRRESVLAPLFKLLEALMDLIVPLVVAGAIDVGIAGGNKGYILKMFLCLIALAAAGLGFSFTAQFFSAKASVGFATKLRQALFDHIQKLSYTQLDTLGTSTLITRMTSDVQQVQNGLNLALRLLLRSPFIVFGAMVMAFTIDVKCAIIFAVVIPLLSIVVFGIMLVSIPLFRKVQKALDSVTGATRQNLTGVRVIRAFCKEEEEVRSFDENNAALTRINQFVGRISALMNPATYFLINLAAIFLIRQGALRVSAGSLQQGQVVALYNYMAQITVELIKLASLIITINKALACADRVADVLDVETGMEYPDEANVQTGETSARGADAGFATSVSAADSAVHFDHVSFTYAGAGADSLTDISFEAKKGQTIGIIGGTGSGKSTIASLIPRFYDATAGSVTIFGKDAKAYGKGQLIDLVGMVPQRAVLFAGTIRDNLRWGNENATDEELWEAIRTAQAEEVVKGKEGQLDFVLEQNGKNLSGGQRQRLTIARALVKKPQILILDDSASALDFATDARLRQAINGLEGNMTVFLISQRTASIRYADQILVLDDGNLAGKGTHDELMASCETYQEIYYSQFPEERPENRADAVAEEDVHSTAAGTDAGTFAGKEAQA